MYVYSTELEKSCNIMLTLRVGEKAGSFTNVWGRTQTFR